MVLSTDTGYSRDYFIDPYEGYYRMAGIWFPVGEVRKDLSPKERVLGIEINGSAKAYPLDLITENPGALRDRLGETIIYIRANGEGEVTAVEDPRGKPIPHIYSYWFAWQAFHPETEVYRR